MDPNNTRVEFEQYRAAQTSGHQNSKMVAFVINHSGGAIKDEKQANAVLLVLAVVIFLISLYFWF
jgi:hypothetical protein